MSVSTLLSVLVLATLARGQENTTGYLDVTPTDNTRSCMELELGNDSVSKCFWMLNGTYTQAGAIVGCLLDGGILATVDSKSEADFVNSTFYPDHIFDGAWLGIEFDGEEWKTLSGGRASWFQWSPGHPESPTASTPDADCAAIDMSTNFWKSVPCVEKAYVLCESTTNTFRCSRYQIRHSKCVWLLADKYSQSEAKRACGVDGGVLSIIQSNNDANFVKYVLSRYNYGKIWLGLVPFGSVWTSLGGRKATWFSWSSNEPSYEPSNPGTSSRACVALDIDTSQWVTVICEARELALCERVDNNVYYSDMSEITSQRLNCMNVNENVTHVPENTFIANDSLITVMATPTLSSRSKVAATSHGISSEHEQTMTTSPDSSLVTDTTHIVTSVVNTMFSVSPSTEGIASPSSTPSDFQEQELARKIEEIKKELTVDKQDLSSTKRKLQCATDYRVSSQSIGIVGLIFIICTFLIPAIIDIPRYYLDLRKGVM